MVDRPLTLASVPGIHIFLSMGSPAVPSDWVSQVSSHGEEIAIPRDQW